MRCGSFFKNPGIARFLILCALTGTGLVGRAMANASPAIRSVNCELRLGAERMKFDPEKEVDLRRLSDEVANVLAQLKKQPKAANASLQAAAKKYKRGLQEIQ